MNSFCGFYLLGSMLKRSMYMIERIIFISLFQVAFSMVREKCLILVAKAALKRCSTGKLSWNFLENTQRDIHDKAELFIKLNAYGLHLYKIALCKDIYLRISKTFLQQLFQKHLGFPLTNFAKSSISDVSTFNA